MIRALVFDIEGTITDIRFVADVLFPFARKHMAEFVREEIHAPDVRRALDAVAELGNADKADVPVLLSLLDTWMAEDRKVGPLKTLQGLLWRQGYESGAFKGHLYPDALPFFRAALALGLNLFIYSSGSVAAQKLLLQYSIEGDLTPLFSGHADTAIGAKTEVESYKNLADQFNYPCNELMFYSDMPHELEAAQQAGLFVTEVRRDGLPSTASTWPFIHQFNIGDLPS